MSDEKFACADRVPSVAYELGRHDERLAIVAWLRGLSEQTRDDWGLNATEEAADWIASGNYGRDGNGEDHG